MNCITFRIAIALLTFVVGIAAVSLWTFLRRNLEEKKIEPMRNEQALVKNISKQTQRDIPAKSWYVSKSLKGEKGDWVLKLVKFYENGEWIRFEPTFEDASYNTTCAYRIKIDERYSIDIGRWEEKENSLVMITIESIRCHVCAQPKNMPIIEHWKIRKDSLEQSESLLLSPDGEYEFLSGDEFLEANKVLFTPLSINLNHQEFYSRLLIY